MTLSTEPRADGVPADPSPDPLRRYPEQLDGRRDEMFDRDGARPEWTGISSVVRALGMTGLRDRNRAITRLLEDDGVSYRPTGAARSQPWRLDPLPLVIAQDEWAALSLGLVQRAELLDAIVRDVYGPRRLIADGLLPPEVVFGHAGFVRAAHQVQIPGPHQLFFASADLGRDDEGRWRVISDRTQAPSGAGFAMENRSVLSRALPSLYRGTAVHRIAPFFHTMRASLQRVAPAHAEGRSPRVVLLSPGPDSETAFDQAFLSALLGLPLALADDLTVRDGRVWQRSLHRYEPVDVLLRRVDDTFCDPLDLRPDSQLGVPGLLEAARTGTVTIVNGIGSGIVENAGLLPFLPGICRQVLGESLLLESAPTLWCGDPDSRRRVLADLGELIVKPISRASGHRARNGWELSQADRDDLQAQIEAQPHQWVAQEPLAMSTAPALTGPLADLQPGAVVLRSFAVTDGVSYHVMPGGLTRVHAGVGAVDTSWTASVSKDVWVLSGAESDGIEAATPGLRGPETVSAAVSPRVAEDLYWLGRYAERAESVIRLLRVIDNRWRDVHPTPDAALARCLVTLLQALTSVTSTWPGFVGEGAGSRLADPQSEIRSLLTDSTRRGGLAWNLSRVRGLADAVRDQLSADTWTILAGVQRSLAPMLRQDSHETGTDEIPSVLAGLLQAMLGFSGIVGESMVRDTGWHLLDAGRRLERGLQLGELLRHTLDEAQPAHVEAMLVESVLITAESIITHRRRYPAHSGVQTVLELLLLDPGNPRSVRYQLDMLERDLSEAGGDQDEGYEALQTHQAYEGHIADAESSLPGLLSRVRRLRDLLISSDPAALAEPADNTRPVLSDLLDTVTAELRSLHDAIETTHFTKPGALQSLEALSAASDPSASEPDAPAADRRDDPPVGGGR